MIQSVWADFPKFKTVNFSSGFNVVTAERTKASSPKDSRNGLGKSSLIEIIHYLLGSGRIANAKGTPLEEWTFYGSLQIQGAEFVISRSPKKPSRVRIESGDVRAWEAQGVVFERDSGGRYIDNRAWANVLGSAVFDLPLIHEEYAPSFRSLISYFIRRGKDAYSTPFSHFRKQYEWDIQVNNAFLLGLDWRDAQTFQLLRDRSKLAEDLQRASDLGIVRDFFGKRGELEARRGRIAAEVEELRSELSSFAVAPQYAAIEDNADQLTTDINELANENYSSKQLLGDYLETLSNENRAPYIDVERIYGEAGVMFEATFRRDLDDVREFHRQLISNRRSYLEAEIIRLRGGIVRREGIIRDLDSRRARYLRALEENRALDHYSAMRAHLEELQDALSSLTARIGALNEVEAAKAQIKIDTELARRSALDHYNEHRADRDTAVALFNDASRHLYETPGNLIINVGKTGYKFSYQIERKGSEGIGGGAIFCYDLTLAQIWSSRSGINCLVHDSTLFDPIEERQVAKALELAADRAASVGFQYICTLNTDRIPHKDFRDGFSLSNSIVLELTDATDDGGLFGIRF